MQMRVRRAIKRRRGNRRLMALGVIMALAATFGVIAALLTPDHPVSTQTALRTSFVGTFVAAFVTGLTMIFLRQSPQPREGRRSRSFRRDTSTVGAEDSRSDNPRRPDDRRSPTPDSSPSRNQPRPPKPPPIKPARRVELAGLTTSGISGLTVDRGSSGPFDVYAATQVGLQHAKDGHTREDAYAIGSAPDEGWVFLAIADGLGSAKNAHAAAQLASQTTIKLMRARVPSIRPADVQEEWMVVAAAITAEVAVGLNAATVDDFARQLGYEATAYAQAKRSNPACTLVFAALGPVSSSGYPLLWGAVGDCELLLVHLDSGQHSWITHNPAKQRGGMVSNVTSALPNDYQDLKAGFQSAAPNTMTVLASDGMAEAIRLEPEQYSSLLPQVAGLSPAEWMFGELVGFDLPGLHDDRTIMAAWPRRQRFEAAPEALNDG